MAVLPKISDLNFPDYLERSITQVGLVDQEALYLKMHQNICNDILQHGSEDYNGHPEKKPLYPALMHIDVLSALMDKGQRITVKEGTRYMPISVFAALSNKRRGIAEAVGNDPKISDNEIEKYNELYKNWSCKFFVRPEHWGVPESSKIARYLYQVNNKAAELVTGRVLVFKAYGVPKLQRNLAPDMIRAKLRVIFSGEISIMTNQISFREIHFGGLRSVRIEPLKLYFEDLSSNEYIITAELIPSTE